MQSGEVRFIEARYMGDEYRDKSRQWNRHCGWLTVGIPTIDRRRVRGGVHVFGCIDDIGNMLAERIAYEQDKLGQPTILVCVNSDFVQRIEQKYNNVYAADVQSFRNEEDFVNWVNQTLSEIGKISTVIHPVFLINGFAKFGRTRGIHIDRMMLRCIEIAYSFPVLTVLIDWIVPAPKNSRSWTLFSDFHGNGTIENGADTVWRIHSPRHNHIRNGDVMLVECCRGNDACWPQDQEIIYDVGTEEGGSN